MMSVAQPILLLGLLAIAIPILIHLFNKSKGRLVQIGNIELIRQAKKIQVTEIKLTRLLLLLLRILIFVLATLLIAGLFYKGQLDSQGEPHILVTPGWIENANPEDIDKLATRIEAFGGQWLTKNFEPLTVTQVSNFKPEEAPLAANSTFWPLLVEKSESIAINDTLEVYATSHIRGLQLTKPELTRKAKWHIVHNGSQNSAGNTARGQLKIAVYAASGRDTSYLQSALEVIKRHRFGELTYSVVNDVSEIPSETDFLFYLSDDALPTNVTSAITQGLNIFRDASTTGSQNGQWILSAPESHFIEGVLYQQTTLNDGDAVVLWENHLGESALTLESQGEGKILRFSGRLTSAWTNLVLQPEFPAVIMGLLSRFTPELTPFQTVQVGQQQLELSTSSVQTEIPKSSLFKWLALLLMLCWMAERIVSERYYEQAS